MSDADDEGAAGEGRATSEGQAAGDADASQGAVDARKGNGDPRHAFWADEVADRVLERDPTEPIVIKGGISPSGVPHLGNVNEIMRGYFVAEALRDRGYDVRQVFTTDDRDPLRKLPRTLADLDGNLVDLGDVDAAALGENLGLPYTDVPDPFGCCDSYGAHFSTLIAESAERLSVPIDVVSTTELYESGRMDDVVEYVLRNREKAREVLSDYQDKVDEDYVPFNPICANCGKVTETVTAVHLDEDVNLEIGGEATVPRVSVEYRCTDMEAGNRTIDGCGHEGTAGVRDGKLPWRFEWPAQWQVLGVDFEPFGKDHAEGSWPSGKDIAENVLEIEPPEPMTYEWFTLDDEAFSSSAGNVILVHDVLRMLDPEVVRYFFTKDPRRARDFSVERLDLLVDEFDRFERLYFGEEGGSDDENALAERAYPPTIRPTVAETFADELREGSGTDEWTDLATDREGRAAVEGLIDDFEDRVRLPYTYAAVLGMYESADARRADATKQGHVPDDAPDWARERAFDRVTLASEWAARTENEYDYTVQRASMPDTDFDAATEAALDDLADFVAEGHDGEDIQGEIFEIARRHDIEVGDFFGAGYRLLFDEDQGPQLGPFVAKLDREFVVQRLRREE